MKNSLPNSHRVEIRQDGDVSRIHGYAAVFFDSSNPETEFRMNDQYAERLMRTAFDNTNFDDPISLFNHDPSDVLGRASAGTLRYGVDNVGLWYETTLDPSNTRHNVIQSYIARGDVPGSSFWFLMQPEGEVTVRDGDRTIFEIHSIATVREFGPVAMAAYRGTSAQVRDECLQERIKHHAAIERQTKSDETRSKKLKLFYETGILIP